MYPVERVINTTTMIRMTMKSVAVDENGDHYFYVFK
jgi:hypothetical protein